MSSISNIQSSAKNASVASAPVAKDADGDNDGTVSTKSKTVAPSTTLSPVKATDTKGANVNTSA
jgi:hypothetical protein